MQNKKENEMDRRLAVPFHSSSFTIIIISFGVQSKIKHNLSSVYVDILRLCFKIVIVFGFMPYSLISLYVVKPLSFIVCHNGSKLIMTLPPNTKIMIYLNHIDYT